MSTMEYKEYLEACSYSELRQLAIDHNVFKGGSKKKEALINKLLKQEGLNESTESNFENIPNFDKENSIDEQPKRRQTYTIDGNKEQILLVSNEFPDVAVPKKGKKNNKKKKSEKENLSPLDSSNDSDNLNSSNNKKKSTRKVVNDSATTEIKQDLTTVEDERRKTYSVESKKTRSRRGVSNDTENVSSDVSADQNERSEQKENTPKRSDALKHDSSKGISDVLATQGLPEVSLQNRRETYSIGKKRKHSNSMYDSPLVTRDSDSKLPAKKMRGVMMGISTPIRSSPRFTSTSVTSSNKTQIVKGSSSMSKEKITNNKKMLNVTFSCDSSGSLKSKTPSKSLLFNNIKKTPRKVCPVTPVRASVARTPLPKDGVTMDVARNTPGLVFSARKMPNFAAIHKKNFAHMESLPSYVERKANRASDLMSPFSLSKSICLGSSLSDSQSNNKKSIKRSNIPIRKQFSLHKEKENVPSSTYSNIKVHSISVQSIREKNREVIKGVRTNKRFLLQMQSRNLL